MGTALRKSRSAFRIHTWDGGSREASVKNIIGVSGAASIKEVEEEETIPRQSRKGRILIGLCFTRHYIFSFVHHWRFRHLILPIYIHALHLFSSIHNHRLFLCDTTLPNISFTLCTYPN
jgi:hypothetical protein